MKFNLQWLSFKCKIIENRSAISFRKYFKIFHNFSNFCRDYGKRKAINIFKHPICDATIWHHKTNVKIQPFWREIGEKWQFKMEMYVLSISPLQWDGRNIKYRKGEKFGINLEERIIHGEWKSAGVGMCKC